MTQNDAETPRAATDEVLADLLAVGSGDAVAPDETVVVNQPVEDRTVAVNPPAGEQVAEDRTIVVSDRVSEAGDHTVVVSQPQAVAVSGSVGQVSADDTVSDGTVVVAAVPGALSTDDERRRSLVAAESNPTPPVDTPEVRRPLRRIVGGLDPRRPISEAPGSMPWEVQPEGERAVAQGLPVAYGARVHTEIRLEVGVDEVQRRVGAVPDASPVEVVQGRDRLPSLRRRDRKRARGTLLAYAGVTVFCACGLWLVAALAFGW